MEQMKEDELQEALEHDAAIKGQQGGNGAFRAEVEIPNGGSQVVTVDPGTLLTNLDIQQASLAKSVAISFTEVARVCAGLALTQLMTTDGSKNRGARTEGLKQLLDAADRALILADKFGAVGDKADARVPLPADAKPVGDSQTA